LIHENARLKEALQSALDDNLQQSKDITDLLNSLSDISGERDSHQKYASQLFQEAKEMREVI